MFFQDCCGDQDYNGLRRGMRMVSMILTNLFDGIPFVSLASQKLLTACPKESEQYGPAKQSTIRPAFPGLIESVHRASERCVWHERQLHPRV